MKQVQPGSVSRIDQHGARWLLLLMLLSIAVWAAIIWFVTSVA